MTAPCDPPALAAGDIHVWRLDLAGDCPNNSEQYLHRADLHRASRFVFDRDRKRFLRARYGTRQLLARYLGTPPLHLTFAFSPNGKPMLDSEFGLGFNLSHSGNFGLLAVGLSEGIGVDIEEVTVKSDVRQVADSVLTEQEMASLETVADKDLTLPFLTCWTRKEACLKALGVGLTVDLGSIPVGTEPARRRIVIRGAPAGSFVEVDSLMRDERCVAAVAVTGGFSEVRFFDWAP